MTKIENIIPSSIESEEALLGSLMKSDKAYHMILKGSLRPSDFYRRSNKIIYKTCLYLHERGTCDELLVIKELEARHLLKDAGGKLNVLTLVEKCPSVTNSQRYIDLIIDSSNLRMIVQTGHEIARLGSEHKDKVKNLVNKSSELMGQLLSHTQRDNGSVKTSEQLGDWLTEHLDSSDDHMERFEYPKEMPRLQSTMCGIGRTEVISIGGYSGEGKSILKNQILLGLPKDLRVGVFSLEMNPDEEQMRLACLKTGISYKRILFKDINEEERESLNKAILDLKEYNFVIHSGIRPLSEIYSIQRTNKYDVVFIDHFHLLPGVEEYKGIVENARLLKEIAMNTNCAVISLFQFNTGGTQSTKQFDAPDPSRVKGGGSLLESSNQMMFVYRDRSENGVYAGTKAKLIIAKNRMGVGGVEIPYDFHPSHMRFVEGEK